MLHNNMMDPSEDMEMAVDAGKLAPAGNDIDIDLVFSDDGQDEMMTEEVLDPTYDIELGDATITAEQDEVMTDEGLEEQIFDEDITDAPIEAIAEVEPDLFLDTEFENHVEPLFSVQSEAVEKEQTTIAGDVEKAEEESKTYPALASPPAVVASEKDNLAAVNQDEEKTGKTGHEEVEELITWESDDEEEETPEVGDTNKEPEPVELAASVKEELAATEVGKDLEHPIDDSTHDLKFIAESNDDEQALNNDVVEEVVEFHEENENAAERSFREGASEEAKEAEKPNSVEAVNNDSALVIDFESDEFKKLNPHVAVLEEQALQQLHPMVIRYMNEEMSLFPPTTEGEHTMFFLGEKKLAFKSCEDLFKAFREVLGENINKDENLVLTCLDLGLDIHEGMPETSTLSVAHLLHLYLGLSNHDGWSQASPMSFVLKHDWNISARLNHLYALLESGKGLSAIQHPTSGYTESGEHGEETQEYEDEQDANAVDPNQVSNEVPEIVLPVDESNVNQDTVATPTHENDPEEEYDLDFRSPAAVQRNKDLSTLEATTEAETESNVNPTAQEHENVTDPVDQQTTAQNTVGYNSKDNGETPEESGTYAKHDGDQSLPTLDSDVHQQNTNIVTDDVLSATKDTDYSNVNDGLENGTEDGPSKEDHFDLEDSFEEYDTIEAPPELGATLDSTNHNTGSGADNNIAKNHQSVSAIDDFEEIGYSSSEDEIEEPLPVKSAKHSPEALQIAKPQSPKRSIDDLDDSTRDSKKLRSI